MPRPASAGGLPSRAAPPGVRALFLCWPQTFKELKLTGIPSLLSPRSFRKRVQKYTLFPNWQALFSTFFHLCYISLIYSEKIFHFEVLVGNFCTLLYIIKGFSMAKTWVLRGTKTGVFIGRRGVFLEFRQQPCRSSMASILAAMSCQRRQVRWRASMAAAPREPPVLI